MWAILAEIMNFISIQAYRLISKVARPILLRLDRFELKYKEKEKWTEQSEISMFLINMITVLRAS